MPRIAREAAVVWEGNVARGLGGISAAWSGGLWPLVVIGVLVSALAAYFYVRVIVLMYWQEPAPDGPTVAVPLLA